MIVPVEFWHVCTPNPWSVSLSLPCLNLERRLDTGHTVVRSFFEIETHVRRQTDRQTGLGPALRAPRDYQEHPSSHPRSPYFPKGLAASSAPRKPQTLIGPPGATGPLQLAGHGAPWGCFSLGLRCLSLELPVTAKGWPSWRQRSSPPLQPKTSKRVLRRRGCSPACFLGSIMA